MIRVVATDTNAVGYDLTSSVSGLRWSNVDPGGDETASFTIGDEWTASGDALVRGNTLTIYSDLDAVWTGRIEEVSRSVGQQETIGVTAYGLGAYLKDQTMTEIYIDQDAGSWGEASNYWSAIMLGLFNLQNISFSTADDTWAQSPGIKMIIEGSFVSPYVPIVEAWYDAGETTRIGRLYYQYALNSTTNRSLALLYADDDGGSNNGTASTVTLSTSGSGYVDYPSRRCAFIRFSSTVTPSGGPNVRFVTYFGKLAVYGTHGLQQSGADPGGFTADQIVGDVLRRVTNVVPRRIDAQTFTIPHFVVDAPTVHEDVITAANEYAGAHWGTWGRADTLDASGRGYFDYTTNTPVSTPNWLIRRAQCNSIDIDNENAGLYDKVNVAWEDSAGKTQITTVSGTAQAIPRTAQISAGLSTTAGANALGAMFLSLQGTSPPARGTLTLSGSVDTTTGASKPCTYLRADGAALRLVDLFASTDSLSVGLSQSKDDVFPIKRVEIDAGGSTPVATISVDQTLDRVSVLQTQLAAGEYLGRAGDVTPSSANKGGKAGKKKPKRRNKGKNRR